ncbi:MAG: VOC family protein [Candidatus Hydrogenedentes bacterium]|nr:VOC family protein [Candidatus Hydrogenedentota bacterium]
MISRLEHMALSVSDLDISVAFYRDLLGLEVIRVLDAGPESGLGEVVNLPGCHARIAHLRMGNNMLEVFEYKEPRGETLEPGRRQADHGWIHLGFQSTDVRADYGDLKAKGVHFLSAPVEFRPGVWIVYFRGPDGEICELRETPANDLQRPP